MKILRMFATPRLALCAAIVHLIFFGFALNGMWSFEEIGCTEAVQRSALDRPVAGRIFFFNYSSDITRALVVANLPALAIADQLVALADSGYGGFSYANRSWANAIGYVLWTTLQWLFLSTLISTALRRWLTKNRESAA